MLKISIRTCVSCKEKSSQSLLNRLQCKEKKLYSFTGIGRSFYLCNKCLQDENKLKKILCKNCKNKDDYIVQLREILRNGRQS